MKRAAALLVVALAGCATPRHWARADATTDDFYRDDGQCKAQAFAIPGAPLVQAAMVYNACMRGKGWRQE